MSNVIKFERRRPDSSPTESGNGSTSSRDEESGNPRADNPRGAFHDWTTELLNDEPIDLYRDLEFRHTLRATVLDQIFDDWHFFVIEVRASPISHLLVAIGAVVFWTLLLVAPLLLGLGS